MSDRAIAVIAEDQIRAGAWCDEPLSVTEARALAASILAAADMAEGTES